MKLNKLVLIFGILFCWPLYAKMSYQFLMPIGYTNTKVSLGHKLCTGTNKFDTTLKHPRYAIGAHWIYASGEVWGEGIDPGCSSRWASQHQVFKIYGENKDFDVTCSWSCSFMSSQMQIRWDVECKPNSDNKNCGHHVIEKGDLKEVFFAKP